MCPLTQELFDEAQDQLLCAAETLADLARDYPHCRATVQAAGEAVRAILASPLTTKE